jgi:PPOX class probable F420-dependent enzyme
MEIDPDPRDDGVADAIVPPSAAPLDLGRVAISSPIETTTTTPPIASHRRVDMTPSVRAAAARAVARPVHHRDVLTELQRDFVHAARHAVLATIAPDGRPRLVPICFVVHGIQPVLYTPIDDKPKREANPLAITRVRDIVADPRVSILVDRWDEDWTRLAWLRCHGLATILGLDGSDVGDVADRALITGALRAKYPQYEMHRLETRPIIRIEFEHATSWGTLDAF